ncbi:hypothetical protein [Streptomyces megasporus]|uniref:hypothetical protein n=1 Tax=Streptomyces megasporus TaxID=44060 RepID=UPI000690CB16|nr:hypothetical protein [Streptomyces megasporus]
MSRPPGPYRSADPVRALLHRHRELCERAVDPLEIAAALEAHGITDRTAARYRHRDVFSLAEELYARTPRADEPPTAPPAPSPNPSREPSRGRRAERARTVLLPLLPAGACAATLGAVTHTPDAPHSVRLAVVAAGALSVAVSVWLCLRLCLRLRPGPRGAALPRSAVWGGCWLAGYALVGDRLLAEVLGGGTPTAAPLAERCVPLGLTAAVAPAVWCARWFAARARRRLRAGRSLEEFATRTRPLVVGVVAVFAALLLAVLTAAHVTVDGGTVADAVGVPAAATTALGALLFTAVLLAAHGFPTAAAGGVVAACALEAAALAAAAVERIGPVHPARLVEAAVTAWGPAGIPALACAAAALALLAFAGGALTGVSAHHRDGP